ncbi:hypothetical protein LWI28_007704 [Acer negundo]|uniref:RNase H type-1 domain-containing protein n=1 Tax=Acer negundo TaxID=4023 RepID=A0AAD5NIW1_ACENE|nr:hypothetical protein LWI28_007704 [Acer negundo]
MAELLAILKACNLCELKDVLKMRKIVIVSDSMEAVSWVNDEEFRNLNLVDIIYDIRSCLRLMKYTSVHHISRVDNSEADFLAKRGASSLLEGDVIKWRID